MSECCERRKKERDDEERRALINRLSRIEGQVRGLRRMVEEGDYCIDVLIQASAVSSALAAFSRELLASHIHTCVIDDIKCGREETVDELCDMLYKLIK